MAQRVEPPPVIPLSHRGVGSSSGCSILDPTSLLMAWEQQGKMVQMLGPLPRGAQEGIPGSYRCRAARLQTPAILRGSHRPPCKGVRQWFPPASTKPADLTISNSRTFSSSGKAAPDAKEALTTSWPLLSGAGVVVVEGTEKLAGASRGGSYQLQASAPRRERARTPEPGAAGKRRGTRLYFLTPSSRPRSCDRK